jgi:hypothetical protein
MPCAKCRSRKQVIFQPVYLVVTTDELTPTALVQARRSIHVRVNGAAYHYRASEVMRLPFSVVRAIQNVDDILIFLDSEERAAYESYR